MERRADHDGLPSADEQASVLLPFSSLSWEILVSAKRLQMILAVSLATFAAGCSYTPLFGFPIDEGDIAAGRQAFTDHQCHQCHSIANMVLPPLAGANPPILELGGETTAIKSYAELMTSIIKPNHAISQRYRDRLGLDAVVPIDTPMPMPNIDTMTVRQLIDIVAFLDSRYQLIEDYGSP